jgi:hypothetical protein
LNYAILGTEASFYQQLRKNADPEMWQAQLARLRVLYTLPLFRTWWHDGSRPPLTESFERFVNQDLRKAQDR